MTRGEDLVSITIGQIKELSGPELLLPPEISNPEEKKILLELMKVTSRMNDSGSFWKIDYQREVDMTNKKPHFKRQPTKGTVPVIEGRMVHAFNSKANEHLEGGGRSATWNINVNSQRDYGELVQFHMPSDKINKGGQSRISKPRIGIRDIVGQTNERTMMAALIPGGVCCGNKVPTLLFPHFNGDARLEIEARKVWICIANSFVFDWFSRKFVTTSMNLFILEILRIPDKITPDSKEWKKMVELYDKLEAEEFISLPWGEIRAKIDALVAKSCGLNQKTMRVIIESFPLLDRKENPIHVEEKSTVTMDVVLMAMGSKKSKARFDKALEIGAIPYRPAGLVPQV